MCVPDGWSDLQSPWSWYFWRYLTRSRPAAIVAQTTGKVPIIHLSKLQRALQPIRLINVINIRVIVWLGFLSTTTGSVDIITIFTVIVSCDIPYSSEITPTWITWYQGVGGGRLWKTVVFLSRNYAHPVFLSILCLPPLCTMRHANTWKSVSTMNAIVNESISTLCKMPWTDRCCFAHQVLVCCESGGWT